MAASRNRSGVEGRGSFFFPVRVVHGGGRARGPPRSPPDLEGVSVTEDRLYTMFSAIAYCGLRRVEACGLRWEDVDFHSGSVMIGPTIVQAGWKAVEKEDAKAAASDDWVRLEDVVTGALEGVAAAAAD